MAKKMAGLGKGFDALLPTNFDNTILAGEGEKIQKLAISSVEADPNQPRRHFDEEALEGLAESIKQYGILQPLVVSPEKDGQYLLIAGERRLRAAQIAGLKQVPAIVRSGQEQERRELALIENVQRVDLSPLEQAASFEYLHTQFNMSYDALAKRLGKAASTITNIVRLLQLPPEAAEALQTKLITEGHARQILALKELPDEQAALLNHIVVEGWSVRQAERFVTSIKEGHEAKTTAPERVQTETPATKELGKRLQTSVHIKRMAHGGRLEIRFKDDDDLARIIGSL